MMALDKELRPDHRHTIHRDRGASSEGSMSPENRYNHRLIFLILLITGSCLHHFCISFFSSSSSSSPLSLSGDTVLISSTTPTPWTTLATPTPTLARRPVSWLPRWLQGTGPGAQVNTRGEEELWWPIRVGHWAAFTTTRSHCLLHPLRLWTVAPCLFHQWTTGKHTGQSDTFSTFSLCCIKNFRLDSRSQKSGNA